MDQGPPENPEPVSTAVSKNMVDDRVHVEDAGVTCLYSGGQKPLVDVVFVHGLGGHPKKTWSTAPYVSEDLAKGGIRNFIANLLPRFSRSNGWSLGPNKKRKSLVPQKQPKQDDLGSDQLTTGISGSSIAKEVFWPQDLLPNNVENVRVMTFGYYSSPSGPSQDNLYTLSKNLLGRLENERITTPNRPIIFIVHSLGGILTKFALKLSEDSTGADAALKTIRRSTKGIIFFGTPHSGSDMANWGELLRRIAGIFAVTNSTLLAALSTKNDNGQLEELRKNFVRMLGPSKEGKFRVFSFRETKPVLNGPLGPATSLVVPLESSDIVSEWASDLTVAENHIDICKFSGYEDPKYKELIKVLQRFLRDIIREDIPEDSAAEGGDSPHLRAPKEHQYAVDYGDPRRVLTRFECKDSFKKISTMNLLDHLNSVSDPSDDTFCWIPQLSEFPTFLAKTGPNILHISGKPGCGKSVLAKYLYGLLGDGNTAFHAVFFACSAADEGRRKPEHVLGWLIHQLIEFTSEIPPTILSRWEDLQKLEGEKVWTLDQLLAGFCELIGQLNQPMLCIIDGLDECLPNPKIKAFMATISSVFNKSQLGRCILISRAYEDLNLPNASALKIDLNNLDAMDEDVDSYIRSEVRLHLDSRPGHKPFESLIIETLQKRADKMYLLVKLLIAILPDMTDSSPKAMKLVLRSLPATLHDIYHKISREVFANNSESMKRLGWLLCAYRPFTVSEWAAVVSWDAFLSAKEKNVSKLEDYISLDPLGDIRRLLSPLIHSNSSNVALCHPTVKEFFSVLMGKRFLAESHIQLGEMCARTIDGRLDDSKRDSFDSFRSNVTIIGGNLEERPNPDFLSYAATAWPYHKLAAEEAGIESQKLQLRT